MKEIFLYFLLFSTLSFIYPQTKKPFILVIDAGHGDIDFGAYVHKEYEKNITLSVSKKLCKYIEKKYSSTVKIIQTRKTDKFISLVERVKIANQHRADLFISIHCNSNPQSSSYGTETYVLSIHRNKDNFEAVKRENSIIFLNTHYKKTYNDFNPNSPESIIKLTLIQSNYLKNSIEFAKKVEENFLKAQRKSRGVKQSGFFVIREVFMPSVLIEIGFITNLNERNFLASSFGQKIIALSIFKAFSSFKSEYDAKNSSKKQIFLNTNSSVRHRVSNIKTKSKIP